MPRPNSYEALLQQIQKIKAAQSDRVLSDELLRERFEEMRREEEAGFEIAFEDLFEIGAIQELQDQFAAATGVGSVITRPDGTAITRPTRLCRLCSEVIRNTEKGLRDCFRFNAIIGQMNVDGPTIQPCSSGGLWNARASISAGGRHVANWLIGQVRDETQSEDRIREYAREIGADQDDAVAAFHEVPAMSLAHFEQVARFLFTLAQQLSDSAYQNLQFARMLVLRDEAEQALRQSRSLQNTVLDNMPDLVWMKDRDGVFLSCNKELGRLYGAAPEDIIGRTDYDFVDAELADFFRLHDRKAREAGGPTVNEEWLTFASDGYRGLFETVKSPIHDADGEFVGILGIARDVTARHRAEQDLRESEERFRALHNASFGGIGIHDGGVILECNQGLADMTGYSTEELIGMNGLLLIAEKSRDMVMQKILSGDEQPYEAFGLRKNGEEFPMRLEGRNVPYKGKQVRSTEFRDLTELKTAAEEQRKLQEQLVQAQKMESVGQLAGGIAHDFNNLLQVILGFGEVALDEPGATGVVGESISQIMKAGERAQMLVSQLLAFSRRQVLDMQEVHLNEIVGDMLKILRRVIGEHIELRFHPGADLYRIEADSGQIGQILTNLCVNARDAMSAGGEITITTDNTEVTENNREEYDWVEPGRWVRLSVSDTGSGIDESMLDQVFEPFFTTKDVGEGTGLGLSTVYGLVTQHRGSIHVHSEVGSGTTFRVYLPTREGRASAPHALAPGSTRGGHETILLAEDDDMVRKLTTTLLQNAGYTVLQARNGIEALTVYDQNAERIDLLLLDVIMPKLGGRGVYDRIRTTRPDLPALFASGYSLNEVHTDFILDEGLTLIQKPARREELLRRVRELLDGRRPPA